MSNSDPSPRHDPPRAPLTFESKMIDVRSTRLARMLRRAAVAVALAPFAIDVIVALLLDDSVVPSRVRHALLRLEWAPLIAGVLAIGAFLLWDTSPREGVVEVGGSVLRVRAGRASRVVPRDAIRSGVVLAFGRDHLVRFGIVNGETLHVMMLDKSDAARLMGAAGVDLETHPFEIDLGRIVMHRSPTGIFGWLGLGIGFEAFTWGRIVAATCLIAASAIVPRIVADVPELEPVSFPLGVLVGVVVFAAYVRIARPTRVTVRRDAVDIRRRFTTQSIPWTSVRAVRADPRSTSIEIALASGVTAIYLDVRAMDPATRIALLERMQTQWKRAAAA